jgi:carbamoyltransferase
VTHVAFARDGKANLRAKAAYVSKHPLKSTGAIIEHVRRNSKTQGTMQDLAIICDADPSEAKFRQCNVEHHLAHVASAYYLSPFDSLAAGFSFDASGDFASMMAARCEGNSIRVLDRVYLPHSLGFFYTALCQHIGFDEFGEEYKVMGLAPYGEDKFGDLMKELVRIEKNRWFSLNTPFFGMHDGGESGLLDDQGRMVMGRLFTPLLIERLGKPRTREEPVGKREKDIARSCQARFD